MNEVSRDRNDTNAKGRRSSRRLRPLEWMTVLQVAILLVGSTWAFGGQADWVRGPLTWWATLSVLITAAALQYRHNFPKGQLQPLKWLLPLVAFNALVLLANANPSFEEIRSGGDILLVPRGGHAGWPSSARPKLALDALWVFDAIWLSCFNLCLVVRRRRAIRGLLVVAVLNALVLAVFGTIQKLSHAKGMFFNAVPTRQTYFFASFVYHNHWGAFVLLMIGAGLALVWRAARRSEARDLFHSPAFGGIIGVGLIAATIPLSGSRSSTLLTVGLGLGTFLHWTKRLVEKRRHFHESVALPFAGGIVVVALAVWGTWFVAQDSIKYRFEITQKQFAEAQARGNIGSRAELYRNTWRMAKEKPYFGWGMASYPHVFMLYNTQESVEHFPVFYHDAHSDWLQSIAEHGFVGSSVLILCALVPLASARRYLVGNVISAYLLASCGVVLLYGALEFPFGNFAVVLSWWLCFFAAIQYARLSDRDRPGLPSAVSVSA